VADFPINDQRHSARQVTASGLYVGNGDAEMRRLKASGFPMPNNPVMARLEARKVASDLQSRGTVSDVQNRAAMAAMRQDRFRRAGSGGAMTRTAANTQMVLPKVRQPLGSLMDKGVPFNVHDPDELTELRRWCRLFFATHPLVPLLIDIYSKFPVMGLEFVCKDPEIEKFYTQMFMNDLNYEEFLPDGLLREYFMVGEVTALAHFNEDLGIWSSEEILNPDMVRVSKSLFVEQERVQLLVKDLVESLRTGPGGMALAGESPSEKYERTWEYQQLTKNYPEIISAAAQNDGLDISDALVSRMVNKAAWWDLRGTPHLLRSFRTLMLEESLNAAQDAVCLVYGQPVLTSNGVVEIQNVKAGDAVLTHRGRYRKVIRTMIREADEPGVTLNWWYDRPMTLTGEHPVYVRRPVNVPARYNMHSHSNFSEGFVRAADVRKYDQVLHPDSPGLEKVSLFLGEHLDEKILSALRNRAVRSCGDEFKVTDDLLWLIGLHVADGSANSKSVRIVVGEGESDKAARAAKVIKDVFGLDAIVKATGFRSDGSRIKSINVELNSTVLGPFFREMCGVGETKRFPSWAFTLTPEQTHHLVEGWLDGDGCRNHVRDLGVAKHRTLQESAAWLMRRAGMITSVFSGKRDAERGWTGGSVTAVKTPRRAARNDRGGYWVEVRSVRHHQVTETVYNLEVKEDNSYCSPIAVHNCDRLYAPMILATLGIENMGDGEPWIPDQAELEDLRDDIQSALAADFKLLCHNFGLNVTSVFGRESVPRFDTDYDRVDAQIMQSWGIGQGLIMGGSGDTYAGTAINREVCEQLMKSAQNKVVRHLRKRMEIVSEAQEFYDYDLKGGTRVPIYETVVEEDEETGEQYTVRVPKLLIPEVKFACVVPGTQVLTPTGQRNVEDIQTGDEVIAWDGTGYVIDTALHTGIEHRDHLVEVATATGRTVRCTADHPFWTSRGWVSAENLTADSLIRTSAGQLTAHVDSDDDIDMLRFLGLLVGDGNYSTTHVSLSVSDPEVDAFVCEQAERMGLTARRKADARTDKVWYRAFSRPAPWKGNVLRNPLHTLLREQGMWGENGHTKRVPPMVWAAGAKGRAAFLSGYFDADGYACRRSGLKIGSVNRALLDDCQVLFESLGIRAQVRSYAYRYKSQKGPGMQSVNHLTVSNNHYFQMLRDTLTPMIGTKIAALDDMARPSTRGRKAPRPVEWDQVLSVTHLPEGGDIVTLGITSTHTHVTAGLVSHNTLNLRDEATERNFVSQLKQLGVPISDKTLAINIPFEFEQELERQAQETIDKGLAQAEAMHVLQQMCDEQDYAYPPELTQHLMATLQLRQGLAQTEQLEDQTKMMDQQIAQASPAGMMGLLPGTTMQPLAGDAQQQSADQQQAAPPAAGQQQVTATMHGPRAAGPSAFPPGGEVSAPGGSAEVIVPKNRQRPEESDEWRGSGELPARQPKEGARRLPPVHLPGRGGASPRDIAKLANKLRNFKSGPSSYRRSYLADQSRVEQAIHRRAAAPVSVERLVHDPGFYELLHAQGHEAEIVADWPEIVGGGAPESRKLLERLLEDYESITGTRPSRNF